MGRHGEAESGAGRSEAMRLGRGEERSGSGMSSYPVSSVMDCMAVSSGVRYEMMTRWGRDDGLDGKQGMVSVMTSDGIVCDM